MPLKNIDFGMPGVGELDHVLHNQGVTDLSWLAVDEAEYRAYEALPKQNLDIIPELQKALTFTPDDNVPHLIPLKPHVIVNNNPLDLPSVSKTDMTDPIRNRASGYVMVNMSPEAIQERLESEFSPGDIKLASKAVNEVISERGLLGQVYIDSKHFPKCANLKTRSASVPKLLKKSLLVLAKSDCAGCVCNNAGRCTSFNKFLTNKVEYNAKLASDLGLDPSIKPASEDWKSFIRHALEAKNIKLNPDGIKTVATIRSKKAAAVTESEINDYVESVAKSPKSALISADYIKFASRMMYGHDDREVLKVSSDLTVKSLLDQYHILGDLWLDADALGGCKSVLAFMKEREVSPKYVVRRSASCSHCHNKPDGACARICKSSMIVSAVPAIKMSDAVSLIKRSYESKGITRDDVARLSVMVKQNFEPQHIISSLKSIRPVVTPNRVAFTQNAHYGRYVPKDSKVAISEADVNNFVGQLMNKGLSGNRLASAMLSKYNVTEIRSVSGLKDRIASLEGVQGVYHIDPTVYADYGLGCETGAKIFKKSGPKNILASNKCTGCTHQLSSGWCSRYAKSLVRAIPENVKSTSRTASSTTVVRLPVVDPVSKFELSNSIEMPDRQVYSSVNVEVDQYEIGD